MRSRLFLTIIFLTSLCLQAQNLVPNPSFEDLQGPCDSSNLYLTEVNALDDWFTPNCSSTSDVTYFSACQGLLYPPWGMPSNFWGNRQAFDGDAYIGMRMLTFGGFGPHPSVQLTQPLIAGQGYCLTMQASLVDSATHTSPFLDGLIMTGTPDPCGYADTTWYQLNTTQLDLSQVDKNGWTEISGSFIAQGGEDHLVISKLFRPQPIDTIPVQGGHQWGGLWDVAWYLDMVSLVPCTVNAIDEQREPELNMLPNMVRRGFPVELRSDFPIEKIKVFDMSGKIQFEKTGLNGSFYGLSTSSLNSGAYVVVISSRSGHKWRRKLHVLE